MKKFLLLLCLTAVILLSSCSGKGTLEEAYTYARDKAKFDFFAVTDHSNGFKWDSYVNKQIAIADSFNEDGKYATYKSQWQVEQYYTRKGSVFKLYV